MRVGVGLGVRVRARVRVRRYTCGRSLASRARPPKDKTSAVTSACSREVEARSNRCVRIGSAPRAPERRRVSLASRRGGREEPRRAMTPMDAWLVSRVGVGLGVGVGVGVGLGL